MTIESKKINDKKTINILKKNILQLAMNKKEGHIGSSFSILHIIYQLYKTKIDNTTSNNLNRFILSKGHASLGLYVVLAHFGYISQESLISFCDFDSNLGGHPNMRKVNGVIASTGSLGHGLPIAVGMAIAKKIRNESGHIYCLIGDGEANEGTIWEASLVASHHKLDNLTCVLDMNHSGDRALDLGEIEKKAKSFGYEVHMIDGHDFDQIDAALNFVSLNSKPKFIVAHTIKGHGVARMENNPEWHHKSPSTEEFHEMILELE